MVLTAHPEPQVPPGAHAQKALPFAAWLATKAVLLASVETKSRLPTFVAVPFGVPELHEGVPGHGGFEPDQTLLVTAEDATDPRMGTVTSDAMPLLSSVGTLGNVDAVRAPASPLPPPSLPCQKQKSEPELLKLLVQFQSVNASPPQRRRPHFVVLCHAANWFTP